MKNGGVILRAIKRNIPQVCTLLEIRKSYDLAKDFGGIDGKIRQKRRKFINLKILSYIKKQNKAVITKKKTIRKEKDLGTFEAPRHIVIRPLEMTQKYFIETLSPGGVVKTRNTEHSGKSWNIPEHEKIKKIFMKKNK